MISGMSQEKNISLFHNNENPDQYVRMQYDQGLHLAEIREW